jgi:hypothetical protein
MAEFVSRTSLPAPTRGKEAATVPLLSISEMGGTRCNTFLTNKIKDSLGLHLAWDEAKRTMTFTAVSTLPKNVTQDDLFVVALGKDTHQAAIAGLAPFFRLKGYDFKASGQQKMALTINEGAKAGYQFSFVLPNGALTPAPKTPRKPRTPKATATPAKPSVVTDSAVADLIY